MRNRLFQLMGETFARGAGVRSEASGTGVEILIYDVIDPWWGVSAKAVAEVIRGAGDVPLTVRVNSPGGDAFEGRAIASLIRAHKGPTRTIVDGLAASAASTIAIAAETVDMAVGSFMMVHRSSCFAMGNAADFRNLIKLLEKVDGEIAADYSKRAGVTLAEADAWMAAETWFTAEEAVTAGLASKVVTDAASFEAFNLGAFDKTPKALTDRIAALKNDATPSEADLRAAMERRLRLFETPA